MADSQSNASNPSAAIAPQVGLSACDLEYFVQPIVHSLALLSELTSNQRTGAHGVDEAIGWLVDETRDRAEELRAITYKKRPRWATTARADERAEVLERLCPDPLSDDSPEMKAFLTAMSAFNGTL